VSVCVEVCIQTPNIKNIQLNNSLRSGRAHTDMGAGCGPRQRARWSGGGAQRVRGVPRFPLSWLWGWVGRHVGKKVADGADEVVWAESIVLLVLLCVALGDGMHCFCRAWIPWAVTCAAGSTSFRHQVLQQSKVVSNRGVILNHLHLHVHYLSVSCGPPLACPTLPSPSPSTVISTPVDFPTLHPTIDKRNNQNANILYKK
jgi:hypothetical protein